MFRLMAPRIEILAGAIGPDDFGCRSFGNGKGGLYLFTLPKCVSTVAEASVKVPIWGQTLKERKPGEVGSIPHTF